MNLLDDETKIQGSVWSVDNSNNELVVIVSGSLPENARIAVKIDNRNPNGKFDIPINYWDVAGLKMSYVAITNTPNSINCDTLVNYIGQLHCDDLKNVLQSCIKIF